LFNPQKILVIRFSALGDLVLTSPIYRELKRVYPQAEITLLSSSGIGSVLANNPHIDHYINHSRKESAAELTDLIRKLRQEKFELIYDAHRSLRSIFGSSGIFQVLGCLKVRKSGPSTNVVGVVVC